MELANSILKVLVYFDLFDYPLLKEEIKLFLEQSVREEDLSTALENLVDQRTVFRRDEFYSFRNDHSLIERRIAGNTKAQPLLEIAYKISKVLYHFPYVRGVGISGSLSKNFADDKADIDFFIITKSNRLWIARTLMHVLKKATFLFGREHWFCMNYFVDEDGLQIEEKNIFTAIELVTLLPVCGNGSLQDFFEANNWAHKYYPNHPWRTESIKMKNPSSRLKKILEHIFDNGIGDRLDDYLLKLTTKRWNKKEAECKLNEKGNPMGLKNSKHVSKPNPAHFHDKILQLYMCKLNQLQETTVPAET